jgi:hypothetical protein
VVINTARHWPLYSMSMEEAELAKLQGSLARGS